MREIEQAARALDAPVARLCVAGSERLVGLDEVEAIFRAREFVVDACRREVRAGRDVISLATRPVLFSLAVALGEAAPGDAAREDLARRAFFARSLNDSLRARLRVEIGRLRRVLGEAVDIRATARGFALVPRRHERVVVLLPPAPGEANALVALLAGGEAWSTSGLAAALGRSQRAVQRALATLCAEGRVQTVGRGRARRWAAPAPAVFATTLLLAPARTAR
jgi:biotin operon repressor